MIPLLLLQLCITKIVLGTYNTLPYKEDFENGTGGWSQGGQKSSWQLGSPSITDKDYIRSCESGQFCWVTGLTTTYNKDELSYVQSPTFNFSTFNNVLVLELWIFVAVSKDNFDGACILYSTSNGHTWRVLGNIQQDWYNSGDIWALYDDSNGLGWTGNSRKWIKVTTLIPYEIATAPSLILRVFFASDNFLEADGFAFDEVQIYEAPSTTSPSTTASSTSSSTPNASSTSSNASSTSSTSNTMSSSHSSTSTTTCCLTTGQQTIPESMSDDSGWAILLVVAFGIVCIIVGIICIIAIGIHRRYFKTTGEANRLNSQDNCDDLEDRDTPLISSQQLESIKSSLIPPPVILSTIGSGNFGQVYKGKWNDKIVALKVLKANVQDPSELHKEAETLKSLKHPNIVRFLGESKVNNQDALIMEFLVPGSLKTVLQMNQQSISTKQLILMALDAARGMAYLEERNVVHRDLALRNLLVHQDDNNKYVVKIGDFGLARMFETNYYKMQTQNQALPEMWTAPEAWQTGKFTSKSDVYSFGIVLWELFSYGQPVHRNITSTEPPEHFPADITRLMKRCWSTNPNDRPTFREILTILENLAQT